MKNIEVTDELLYKYMPLADDAEADALEAEIAGEEYVLSKKFDALERVWEEYNVYEKRIDK